MTTSPALQRTLAKVTVLALNTRHDIAKQRARRALRIGFAHRETRARFQHLIKDLKPLNLSGSIAMLSLEYSMAEYRLRDLEEKKWAGIDNQIHSLRWHWMLPIWSLMIVARFLRFQYRHMPEWAEAKWREFVTQGSVHWREAESEQPRSLAIATRDGVLVADRSPS